MPSGWDTVPDTDREWRVLGEKDPYWGVITHDKYRLNNLTEESVEEFYDTGERYTDRLLETIRVRLDPDFAPATALDFGCGVGRVLIPLARRCKEAVGVDVSQGMLDVARTRCDAVGVSNARLIAGGDALSNLSRTFDLVHAFIVLQHVPPVRGMQILRRLVELVGERGVGVLHVGYGESEAPARAGAGPRAAAGQFARRIARPLVARLRPRVERSGPAPVRSFEYDLNAAFAILQEAGIRRMHVEFTDHAGLYGVMMFFRRSREAGYVA